MVPTLQTPSDFKNCCNTFFSFLFSEYGFIEASREYVLTLGLRLNPYQVVYQRESVVLELRGTHHGFGVKASIGFQFDGDFFTEFFDFPNCVRAVDPAFFQTIQWPQPYIVGQEEHLQLHSKVLQQISPVFFGDIRKYADSLRTERAQEWSAWCDQRYRKEDEMLYSAWGKVALKYIQSWAEKKNS